MTAPPPTPPVISPQARSPSRAPTAAAPLPTAPTFGPTSRPTRMSRNTSARHAPEPSPECPCSTSTKSRAAQGGHADSQGSFRPSGPSLQPGVASPSSRRKYPASWSLPQHPLLSSTVQVDPGDHFLIFWMPCQAWGGGGGGLPQGPSWQPLLPASVELAFLRSSVTPELFGCSCLELGDKSRQTETFLPPREPQAAPPGGAPHYASGHPQVPRGSGP